MPVIVRPKRKDEGGKPWKIVERDGGRVVGESDSKSAAQASANARNAARHGFKPTRRR